MKVNGRPLMDRKGLVEYEEFEENNVLKKIFHPTQCLGLKYIECWNIPFDIHPQQKDNDTIKKINKRKRQIYNMMNEKNPNAQTSKLLQAPLFDKR